MAVSSGQVNEQQDELRKRSEDLFSSEKREDVWAILLALLILLLSFMASETIYHFFEEALFLF